MASRPFPLTHRRMEEAYSLITSSAPPRSLETSGLVSGVVCSITIRLTIRGLGSLVCLHTGAPYSVIDTQFLRRHYPDAVVKALPTPMELPVMNERIKVAHYTLVDIFIPAMREGEEVMAKLERQQLLVTDISEGPGMLFGQDMIRHHRMIINTARERVTITRCGHAEARLMCYENPTPQRFTPANAAKKKWWWSKRGGRARGHVVVR